MPMSQRLMYVTALQSILGFPYIYGASGPTSFDCSGAVNFCLKNAGVNMQFRLDAAELYDFYHNNKVLLPAAPMGSLCFYQSLSTGKINHVMSILRMLDNGERVVAGARGGDSTTVDIKTAVSQGALVSERYCSQYMPKQLVTICDPFIGQ